MRSKLGMLYCKKRGLLLLMQQQSDAYYFATAEEIESLGVNTASGKLKETIGDHTKKIIQENEGKLMSISGVGEIYTVDLF